MKTLVFVVLFVAQCASGTIFLDCTYTMHAGGSPLGTVYTCINPRVIQINQTRNVVGVSQNHLAGRSNQDVISLIIQNELSLDFIPEDINLFFSNLEGIIFNNCPITTFTKYDLRPFPKMRHFGIHRTQMTTIRGDVFQYLPDLERLQLNINRITNIGPGLFQYTPKLSVVFFDSNLCINSQATSIAAVATMGAELAFRCPPTVEMIEEIILDGDNFRTALNDQLQLNLTTIDNRVQILEEENRVLLFNQTMFGQRVQHLEQENQNAKDRIDTLEQIILYLCGMNPTLCP